METISKTQEESSNTISSIFSSDLPMLKKYTAIVILLSDVHKNGNELMKEYAVHLAKLLGNIINASNNIILTELKDALEHVLVSYMADIRYLLKGGTISEESCNELSRSNLLKDINAMVNDQMKHGDKIAQVKEIMFSVY